MAEEEVPGDPQPHKVLGPSAVASPPPDTLECAICLESCIHPAKLPCGHVFCFLCIKGIAMQSRKCAMCRETIPSDYMNHPVLLAETNASGETFDDGYQWFYEGRNGWWQYDDRTSKELEHSYKSAESTCEVLIAGYLYVVDLQDMLQVRRSDPSRRRKVKRDLASAPKKGIAGLRTSTTSDDDAAEGAAVTPTTPSNTPQQSGRESPAAHDLLLRATVEGFSCLNIDVNNVGDSD